MSYRLIWEAEGFIYVISLPESIPRSSRMAMRDGLRAAGCEARIQVEREWADVDE